MKKVLIGLAAILASTTVFAENRYGVGIGAGVSNNIYKGDKTQAYPIPLFDVDYGNFYLKAATLGYRFYKNDKLSTSIYIDPLAGFPIKGKDMKNGYKNIDDRDFQVMGGIRLDAETGIYGIRTGLNAQFGEHGAEGRASLYKMYFANNKLTIIPGIHFRGFSKHYTDYYFGVTSKEVERSSRDNLKNEYKGGTAYSYGAVITLDYKLAENVSLDSFFGIEKFSSDISDSPIVERDWMYMIGGGIKYFF